MKKKYLILLIAVTALVMLGCKKKEESYTSARDHQIEVGAEGNITSTLIDVFDKDYYNQEEFRSLVENEIANYNSGNQEDVLELDILEVEEQNITLRMKYATAADYASFNKVILFKGTISEALAAGYDFNTSFIELDGQKAKEDEVAGNVIRELGNDYQVIITNEVVEIIVPSTISYISNNMGIETKKVAYVEDVEAITASTVDDSKTLAYVVYK
jgi:hypothetical protein